MSATSGAQPHLCAGIVRVDLERPEEPAERQLLLVGHRLLRKDQDAVTVEGRVDFGKDFGDDRTGQIDPAHLGAEAGVKRGELDNDKAAPGKHLPVI